MLLSILKQKFSRSESLDRVRIVRHSQAYWVKENTIYAVRSLPTSHLKHSPENPIISVASPDDNTNLHLKNR